MGLRVCTLYHNWNSTDNGPLACSDFVTELTFSLSPLRMMASIDLPSGFLTGGTIVDYETHWAALEVQKRELAALPTPDQSVQATNEAVAAQPSFAALGAAAMNG